MHAFCCKGRGDHAYEVCCSCVVLRSFPRAVYGIIKIVCKWWWQFRVFWSAIPRFRSCYSHLRFSCQRSARYVAFVTCSPVNSAFFASTGSARIFAHSCLSCRYTVIIRPITSFRSLLRPYYIRSRKIPVFSKSFHLLSCIIREGLVGSSSSTADHLLHVSSGVSGNSVFFQLLDLRTDCVSCALLTAPIDHI